MSESFRLSLHEYRKVEMVLMVREYTPKTSLLAVMNDSIFVIKRERILDLRHSRFLIEMVMQLYLVAPTNWPGHRHSSSSREICALARIEEGKRMGMVTRTNDSKEWKPRGSSNWSAIQAAVRLYRILCTSILSWIHLVAVLVLATCIAGRSSDVQARDTYCSRPERPCIVGSNQKVHHDERVNVSWNVITLPIHETLTVKLGQRSSMRDSGWLSYEIDNLSRTNQPDLFDLSC